MIATMLRYHVPRSQVWAGSRGGQSGRTHLHVARAYDAVDPEPPVQVTARIRRRPGEALCGRRGWYERPPLDDIEREDICPRCADILTRAGASTRTEEA